MVLGQSATSAYIRWISPVDITQVVDPASKLTAFFFAPELPFSPDMILKLAAYGTLSECFIDKAAHHVEAWERGLSPAAFNALQAEK
jgi:hypothetical protein